MAHFVSSLVARYLYLLPLLGQAVFLGAGCAVAGVWLVYQLRTLPKIHLAGRWMVGKPPGVEG